MNVIITSVLSVDKHPEADRLTIVTVKGPIETIGYMAGIGFPTYKVVANLQDDGTPRWVVGEVCVYVPENAIVPDDVLRERGYWDEVKARGVLGGSKGNRVKMQRFAGFESRGLLFKVREEFIVQAGDGSYCVDRGDAVIMLDGPFGADAEAVTEFLGITEYVPA